ncbi:MAG: hypothetical protein ACXWX1_10695 [Aeromicrobium sp.]
MDAFAQLALMAKAKRVFESSETFLSFPALSPLSYVPDELRFGTAAEMTAQDLLEASEFARIANQIPRSVIAPIDEGEYLWDVYRDILQTAQVATGVMSMAEKETYDKAMGALYQPVEGGLRTDSEKLRTYKQHRDAVFEAEEEYKNQQLTAEASTDPALLEKWKNEDEPSLRGVVQERKDAWASTGFKEEIEAAQQVEQAGAAKAPATVWGQWRGQFVDDLDMLTASNQFRFAITGYSPTDILDADNWPRFTLSGDEIKQLVDQAPPELRDIFAGGSGASEIESLSFEYRSAAATRPWLQKDLFKSRFWRLQEGAEPLSDGAEQPTGRLPAYVSAVVFARNVVIKHKETSAGATDLAAPMTMLLRLDPNTINPSLRNLVLHAKPARVFTPMAELSAEPARPLTIDASRAALRLRSMSFAGAGLAPMAADGAAIAAATSAGSRLRLSSIGRPILMHAVASAGAQPVATEVVTAAPAEPPPSAEPPPEPARADEVMVLAFICKRLPRSPDPDLSLSWN